MNAKDVKRLETMRTQANKLMNGKPSLNPVVTTAMVTEALISDLDELLAGRNPKWLAELIQREESSA